MRSVQILQILLKTLKLKHCYKIQFKIKNYLSQLVTFTTWYVTTSTLLKTEDTKNMRDNLKSPQAGN
jgi:hypothetical protein